MEIENKYKIPKFRARKIDSNEYVVGFYFIDTETGMDIIMSWGDTNVETVVDISTLSIHHHDMLDSENNPIFASLSEDGKGGDTTDEHEIFIFSSLTNSVITTDIDFIGRKDMYQGIYSSYYKSFKIIGIQK